jgi:hypothetical protein
MVEHQTPDEISIMKSQAYHRPPFLFDHSLFWVDPDFTRQGYEMVLRIYFLHFTDAGYCRAMIRYFEGAR